MRMKPNPCLLRFRRRSAALWLLMALGVSSIGCGASAQMAPPEAPSGMPARAADMAAAQAPAAEMPGIPPAPAQGGAAQPVKTSAEPPKTSPPQAKSSPNAPKIEEAQKP